MLLWVKIRILTLSHFGGRGGKSSTVTTTHVIASQKWVEDKPKTILWQSDGKKSSEKYKTEPLTEKERPYLFHF